MWKTTKLRLKFRGIKKRFGSFLILEYEQIVEIKIHSSIENFQPGSTDEQRTKS